MALSIDSKRIKASLLPHGVLLFKHCLNTLEQIQLLEICLGLSKGFVMVWREKSSNLGSDSKRAIPVLFYNWPGRPNSTKGMTEPKELLQWARELFSKAYRDVENISEDDSIPNPKGLKCPSVFFPEALYGILYPKDGEFKAHLDGAKGWVLAVSIGESARFFYSDGLQGDRTYVEVNSGDAIIFNGGVLHHGIEKVLKGTAPSFWCKYSAKFHDMARFNLQFRDPINDRLTYDPHFHNY